LRISLSNGALGALFTSFALGVATAGCQSNESPPLLGEPAWQVTQAGGFSLALDPRDSTLRASLIAHGGAALAGVYGFFGDSIRQQPTISVFPSRAYLTNFWRSAWGQPSFNPECWMIAAADSRRVQLLSPLVWAAESCGHNAADQTTLARVVMHEMVHVYHRQANPSPTFVSQADLWWFVEGLAVFASGQFDAAARARVKSAVNGGLAPASLSALFTGAAGYDGAGSLVAFIDARFGRAMLISLKTATSTAGLLATLGQSEPQVIQQWHDWVLSQ